LPPVHWHGKTFFWAEISLIPFAIEFLKFHGPLNWAKATPTALKYTIGACLIALFAGLFRGEDAQRMSIYPMAVSDAFSKQDLVVFLRWIILFATPFIVGQSFSTAQRRVRENLAETFVKTLGVCVFIAACAAVAEKFGTNLFVNLGYHDQPPEQWLGRSYGPFVTPLEAGLVFAAAIMFCVSSSLKRRVLSWPIAILGLTSALALIFTHTGTAVIALALTLFFIGVTHASKKVAWFVVTGVFACSIMLVSVAPHEFLRLKFHDLIIRADTWKHWLAFLPSKPWYAIIGIGWSRLISDNSYLLLLMKGGVILLGAVLLWVKDLWRTLPAELKPIYLFWLLTWLTLDSIGYWASGRALWMLWGLLILNADKSDGFSQKNS
jgi:hypothetical protein